MIYAQIPCYNEEGQLAAAVAELRAALSASGRAFRIAVIDDGSTDGTLALARALGVDLVVPLGSHRGLAAAFQAGLDACFGAGASVVVNFDADRQYPAAAIESLIEPLFGGVADLVVGERDLARAREFSIVKRALQMAGSAVVRRLAGVPVRDVTSGFRALNAAAWERLRITDPYTYTIESLLQAGARGIRCAGVPVARREAVRPSRLVRGNADYVRRTLATLVRFRLDPPSLDGDGHHFDKHASRNPVHAWLVRRYVATLLRLVEDAGTTRIVDAGCGEGAVARALAGRGLEVLAVDRSERVVRQARRAAELAGLPIRFEARALNELTRADVEGAAVVVAEVLEHCADPAAEVAHVASLGAAVYILSVPREPLWRLLNVARLAYLPRLGNTPGHVQHWSRRGFEGFLRGHFAEVEIHGCAPWTFAVCREASRMRAEHTA